MGKFFKYTIYVNLIISIASIAMAINLWSVDRTRAYIFVFLAVVTAFMFFFRRHYFNKFEQRKQNSEDNK